MMLTAVERKLNEHKQKNILWEPSERIAAPSAAERLLAYLLTCYDHLAARSEPADRNRKGVLYYIKADVLVSVHIISSSDGKQAGRQAGRQLAS